MSNHSSPLVSKGLLLTLVIVFFTITAVWLWIGKCCSPNSFTDHEEHETKTEMKAGH